MTGLDFIINNNNLNIVKSTLDMILIKLKKQESKNTRLINQLESDINRLEDCYMFFNHQKQLNFNMIQSNKNLESFLLSAKFYILDLEKEKKEFKYKKGLNDEVLIENLTLKSDVESLEYENEMLRNRINKIKS